MPFFDDQAYCKDDDSVDDSTRTNEYDSDDSFIASENSEDLSHKELQEEQVEKGTKKRKSPGRPSIKERKKELEEKPVGH